MTIVEDMRSVDPLEYIRGVGLQPEDCYGFLPLDLHDVSPIFFLYRDRPEYEQKRVNLPGPEYVQRMGPVEIMPAEQENVDLTQMPGGGGIADVIAQAQQLQQQWGAAAPGVAGAPLEPDPERIKRVEKLREIGAINDAEYARLLVEAGGTIGDAPISEPEGAASDAAPLVMHRIYPGLRMRSSTRQLDHFAPRYREALGLCSEDVYGVFPRSTRTSNTGDGGNETEWDDFWIVYRDRPEYEAGREAWSQEMNKKGKWPAVVTVPGVASPGGAVYDRSKVEVEKDRWPREKMVMRKKGTDLGDALREKIGKWGFDPEDSLGFCPDFDNSGIYFVWVKR